MSIFLAPLFLGGMLVQAGPAYPDRPGKKTVEKVCGGCHGLRLMEKMRKSRAGWRTAVDDMVTKGMKAEDEEIETVVEYFARYLTRLNVNQATAADIVDVLDLSPQQAEAIVAYRKENGRIKSFDELEKIPGLAAGKLAEQRDRIAFTAAAF